MELAKILEQEPEFKSFYDRLSGIVDKATKDIAQNAEEIDEEQAAKSNHYEAATDLVDKICYLYLHQSSDDFKLITSILNLGFLEHDQLNPGFSTFLDTCIDNIDDFSDHDFHLCLEQCKTIAEDYQTFKQVPYRMTRNRLDELVEAGVVFSKREVYSRLIPTVLTKGPATLRECKSLVPEELGWCIDNHFKVSWDSKNDGRFLTSLSLLPGLLREAINETTPEYDLQFNSMLNLFGYCNNSLAGQFLISGVKDVCDRLSEMGKLDYYDRIAQKLHPIAKITPYNLRIIAPGLGDPIGISNNKKCELPDIIRSYDEAGLSDKFFDTLDLAISLYESETGKSRAHDRQKDPYFQFFVEYPKLFQKYGDKVDEYFVPMLRATQNDTFVRLEDIDKLLTQFLEEDYHERVDFNEWVELVEHGFTTKVSFGSRIKYMTCALEALSRGIPKEAFKPYVHHLDFNDLFDEMPRLAGIINSDAEESVKHDYIEYFYLLKALPDVTNVDCNDNWIRNIAEKYGYEYEGFISLLNKMIHDRYEIEKGIYDNTQKDGEEYVYEIAGTHDDFVNRRESLKTYLERFALLVTNGFNLENVYGYIGRDTLHGIEHAPEFYKRAFNAGHLSEEERNRLVTQVRFYTQGVYHLKDGAENNLADLVNPNNSVDDILGFVDRISEKIRLLEFHPATDLDSDKWLREAEVKAREFVKEQGIDLDYPPAFMFNVLASTREPTARRDLLRLASLEEQGMAGKRLFKLGKVYGSEQMFGLTQKLDPVDAARLLLYGLLSRSNERILEATEYFLPDKLSLARSFIERSNCPPRTFYQRFKGEIDTLLHSPSPERRLKSVKNIIDRIRDVYLSSQADSEGKIELRESVWLVESLYQEKEIFDTLTAKMQDGTLWDLADGRRLMCCAMLSEDRDRKEIESLYYCLDPYIALMHVTPSLNGEYSMPIAAAIMANTKNTLNNDVMLVDSIEGGVMFQNIENRQSFNLVLRGIAGAAEDTQSQYVFFNSKVANGTSMRFNSYIRKISGVSKDTVDLIKIRDDLNVHRPRRYLEAFQDQENLEGQVTGYLVPTEMLREAVNAYR